MNTEKKRGKRENLMGKTPPQSTMLKKKERQLLGNCVLHSKMVMQKVEFLLSESLGEDVDSLFRGRTVLQVNDPVMNQLSDVMHMDLDVFCPLSLHWVSAKL
jgi:hypothetical protein